MFPIEREAYIGAHIAAISDEMQQARRYRRARSATPGALDRLYETVARRLNRGRAGTRPSAEQLAGG